MPFSCLAFIPLWKPSKSRQCMIFTAVGACARPMAYTFNNFFLYFSLFQIYYHVLTWIPLIVVFLNGMKKWQTLFFHPVYWCRKLGKALWSPWHKILLREGFFTPQVREEGFWVLCVRVGPNNWGFPRCTLHLVRNFMPSSPQFSGITLVPSSTSRGEGFNISLDATNINEALEVPKHSNYE